MTDESGEPLVFVNIAVQGTSLGTITDNQGRATLSNIPDSEVIILISFIGFEEKEIRGRFPQDNDKTIELELEQTQEILKEIIIETTRSSRSIEDIPTRIEIITEEELGEKAAMNSANIGMLLRETTGVLIQQTSLSSGNMSIRIQGLDGRYTQILKDGFPLYGGFAGGLSIMQIPPLDLKQVELIKGSNSTLFGGGAIAGLVNLITIKPEETPELNLMLNQTSAIGTTGNIFYSQRYGKTGFSLYGAVSNQVEYDPDDDGFSNLPDAGTINLNPIFYLYFNDHTNLRLGLNYTADKRTGGDMMVIKEGQDGTHAFFEKNISNRYSSMLHFENRNNKRTISIKNSLSYFERDLKLSSYGFGGNQISGFSEFMYNLHKSEISDWSFGANYYTESFKESPDTLSNRRNYSYHTLGSFIQNTSTLNSSFILESGLRTDYDLDYGVFVLPRIALQYKPAGKITTRIGGALGYKLPTIFTEDAERIYFENIFPIDISSMNPETSIGANFDVNYKTILFDKLTFSMNQLFFYTRLKNSIVLRENVNQTDYYFENADGNINSSGFETNLKFAYSDFSLYFNYAYINTKLNYDNINKQKPLTPKHNAGLVLMYEEEDNWSVGYELYYTGSQFDKYYDRKPDYWIMGFMVMKQFERISIFINFENFTNTLQSDYEPLVHPPYDNPTFPEIWAPSDGFIFNGGLKLDII
ncbi:TonB-dependent receptor plug domain-containing protein [Bacteroidota bacterium]